MAPHMETLKITQDSASLLCLISPGYYRLVTNNCSCNSKAYGAQIECSFDTVLCAVLVQSCRRVMTHNRTIQCHSEEDGFPFESDFFLMLSQGVPPCCCCLRLVHQGSKSTVCLGFWNAYC